MAPANPGHGNGPTLLALLALLVMAWLLLLLIAMVLPQILGLVVVVGGLASFMALNYLLWGHWLSRMLAEAQQREDETAAQRPVIDASPESQG